MKMKKNSLHLYWNLLATHIRPQRASFVLLLLLVFGSVSLRVFGPQLMRYFIDSALSGQALAVLLASAAAYIGIALAQQVVSIGSNYLGEKVAWRATNALRGELAGHALRLDMSFHNNTSPGQLIERIDGDVSELSNFFSFFALMLASNLLLMLGITAALFLEDWRLGLGFAVFIIFSVLFLARFKDIARPFVKARRQKFTEMYGLIEEHLSGTEDLRSSGAVEYSVRQLMKHSTEIYRHTRKSDFRMFLLNATTDLLLTIGLLIAMLLGFRLHGLGLVTAGTVYLFIHYLMLLDEPIWAMTRQMEAFQTIGACVERLNEFRDTKPKLAQVDRDNKSSDGATAEAGTIEGSPAPAFAAAVPLVSAVAAASLVFENVTFSYNDADTVLDDVNFALPPGNVLGVLGRTGSGKSTLVRLVARLYDPVRGRVLLDGQDVRRLPSLDLRHKVAMVTQDVQLFRASIRDNLSFFDRSYSDDQLLEAMRELGLEDWFKKQPEGLDTRLDSGGRSLSAGEAQLLAFTRVFLRNPGMVILDEASSRLDPATEQLLERAIDRLLQGRSAIVIAHRLATVRRADDILVLDGGRVAEFGSRLDLLKDPESRFSRLLSAGMEEVLA